MDIDLHMIILINAWKQVVSLLYMPHYFPSRYIFCNNRTGTIGVHTTADKEYINAIEEGCEICQKQVKQLESLELLELRIRKLEKQHAGAEKIDPQMQQVANENKDTSEVSIRDDCMELFCLSGTSYPDSYVAINW